LAGKLSAPRVITHQLQDKDHQAAYRRDQKSATSYGMEDYEIHLVYGWSTITLITHTRPEWLCSCLRVFVYQQDNSESC